MHRARYLQHLLYPLSRVYPYVCERFLQTQRAQCGKFPLVYAIVVTLRFSLSLRDKNTLAG